MINFYTEHKNSALLIKDVIVDIGVGETVPIW